MKGFKCMVGIRCMGFTFVMATIDGRERARGRGRCLVRGSAVLGSEPIEPEHGDEDESEANLEGEVEGGIHADS
ncbi:hypothetical protein WK32_06765 [Burkholderia vietnamiensis]|uniref:Uncharacterized protein n=1 Tax=Burkholderia vietnamiensis TaxID=60552 RepID=A0AA44XXJ5_BURVI|nr:hypothetical protein WK32_06765 [Burkholderia vietnamiensis]PRH40471.1 hypothetical protein C6T65_20855 [Burkholderia vietnamiensis]